MMDRLTLIRSVDCSASDHTPITMQAGNALARRTNDGKDGGGYPSMGSISAKFRGANAPGIPGYIASAPSQRSDIWGAGHMGRVYEPVDGKDLAGRLALVEGMTIDRLGDRRALSEEMDGWKRKLGANAELAGADQYTRQAYDVLLTGRAQRAFNLDEEKPALRDALGRDSLGAKALLARRLAEAGGRSARGSPCGCDLILCASSVSRLVTLSRRPPRGCDALRNPRDSGGARFATP